ncbi:heme ABC transporter ATP-binding protein CcmA [Paramagnetospirillum marisnigri]|uniref:Heme ABC transporter ATP-binding protein CcmA n=1 Tax=Paramagnetospirillum marisnigri TaxID=1285242 RepID=A0A178MH70_9PROT|nr:heme ABC exporter ATP-binding protein CcmA [Paramagnetospirillum marisnigri]OAN48006.1 heme ABC transporter ATP-binding protein CcmA [Paramagnetospirillum marisnigri]
MVPPMTIPAAATFSGTDLACLRGGRVVFAGLGFSLESGGALVLLGPNGSGKSSLLRVMAGLLRPAHGVLAWDGEPVGENPEGHNARTHYLGHHDAVKPVLTVAENLRFWAHLHDSHAGRAGLAVETALDRFGLSHLAAIPGKMLSAGQKRRTNLARLLAAPSPLWLLDEPTTALDKASIKALEAVLAEHRAQGGMVVLSTHADIDLPGATEMHLDEFAVAEEFP